MAEEDHAINGTASATWLFLSVMRSDLPAMRHWTKTQATTSIPVFKSAIGKSVAEAMASAQARIEDSPSGMPLVPVGPKAEALHEKMIGERVERRLALRFLRVVGHAWLEWQGQESRQYRAFYPVIHEIPDHAKKSLRALTKHLKHNVVTGYVISDPLAPILDGGSPERVERSGRGLTNTQVPRLHQRLTLRSAPMDIGIGELASWCDTGRYSWDPKARDAQNCSEWAICTFNEIVGAVVFAPTKSVNAAADAVAKDARTHLGGCSKNG